MLIDVNIVKGNGKNNKTLVVFIHGLGAPATWEEWTDILRNDDKLKGMDIGIAKYETAHFCIPILPKKIAFSFPIWGKRVSLGSLLSIKDLAQSLKNELESDKISKYEKIILVGHSMGGLIAGYYLLKMVENKENHNVIGFISVASPFGGSGLAKYMEKFQINFQVKELNPKSDFLKELEKMWDRNKYTLIQNACIAFAYAQGDLIVHTTSAVPKLLESRWNSLILPGGHTSVLSIKEERKSKTYQYIVDKIRKFADTPRMIPIMRNQDILTLEEYWDSWANATVPQLKKELFTIGRKQVVADIGKWLVCEENSLNIAGETKEEALLTFIATVYSVEDEVKDLALGLTYVVCSLETWNRMVNTASDLTLIPLFKAEGKITMPINCRVVMPLAKNDVKFQKNKVEVKKQNHQQFVEALKEMGINPIEINMLAERTNKSIPALCRRIAKVAGDQNPLWTQNARKNELIPALLIGKWREHYEGDREFVQDISSKEYEEFVRDMTYWHSCEDAPLSKSDDCYRWTVLDDGWEYLYGYITENDMQIFTQKIKIVFKSINPKFELPEEQWYAAAVYGRKAEYSDELCNSLATSLVMLAIREEKYNNFNIKSTQSYIDGVVRQIFLSINSWQQWFSIAPFVQIFAEASPEEFLNTIDNQARGEENSAFFQLFKKTENALFKKSYYTYVLWGLEMLAWNKEYTSRCCKILAKLAEQDIDYKVVNSPMNSLYHILLPWKPQTMLDAAGRKQIIEVLLRESPATAWNLIQKLIPQNGVISNFNERPKWREWEIDYDKVISSEEFEEQIKMLSELLVKEAGNSAKRWNSILDKFEYLINESTTDVVNLLIGKKEMFKLEERMIIREKLQKIINKHRKFANAVWSMSEEKVKTLERAYRIFEPEDVIRKHLFLFNEWWPAFVNPLVFDSSKKEQMEIEGEIKYKERKVALLEIFKELGERGLQEVLTKAIDDREIGVIIAKDLFENEINWALIKTILNDKPCIVMGYFFAVGKERGEEEIAKQIKERQDNLTFEQTVKLLYLMPLSMVTWRLIEELGYNYLTEYWTNCNIGYYHGEDVEFIIDKFFYFKRPYSALNAIGYRNGISSEILFEALERCLAFYPRKELNGTGLERIHYLVIESFRKLQIMSEVENTQMARLEWSYLPLIKGEYQPQALISEVKGSPQFFVELISSVYKSEDLEETISLTPEEKNRISLSRDLLKMINSLPGFEDDGVDEEFFKAWMNVALEGCKKNKRTKIGEQQVGELLSHSPKGIDGNWPHECVREFIENHYTNDLKDGFVVGLRNQRGVYYGTGGAEEKAFQNKYKSYADNLNVCWPRCAAILRSISNSYHYDSIVEEERDWA